MTALIVAILILAGITANAESNLDSLISVQRELVKGSSVEIFNVLESRQIAKLSPTERDDLRFLLAYLPLADQAGMTADQMIENVRLAQKSLTAFSWGKQVPADLYRNFVLPHRVSQEPYRHGWRSEFMETLAPRVKDLSMTAAALEVNHWCHEVATFVQTSGRDQDPLTTIRSGFGRCEEEMILAIAALRSIGIPARQCYTPYWPHTDNNHAWVEVWTDGRWSYFGACEPAEELCDAWFTASVARAMLVISTAYGEYTGNEPVLKEYDKSTLINSTRVYGKTRRAVITMLDRKDRPLPDKRLIFSLFNYSALMPALALQTDEDGRCEIECGIGDWIVTASDGKYVGFETLPANSNDLTVRLDKESILSGVREIDYSPPAKPESIEKADRDSLFKARLALEDSLRNSSTWSVWAREAGIPVLDAERSKPDSIRLLTEFPLADYDSLNVYEILEKSRGNWGTVYCFLTGDYPVMSDSCSVQEKIQSGNQSMKLKMILLGTLEEKDLRDFSIPVLEDHYRNTTIDYTLADPTALDFINSITDSARKRFKEYVLAPRIDREPSEAWRSELIKLLKENPALVKSRKDKKLVKWLRKNISVAEKPDRLGPSLSPEQVLKLRRGTEKDIARLYIGLCRVRGIPARFNPVSGELEKWNDDEWQIFEVIKSKKQERKSTDKGLLFVDADATDSTVVSSKYLKDWSVERWNSDLLSVLDFGYKKPYADIEWGQELPVGLYCITTGFRREDGSAPVRLEWFRIEKKKETRMKLIFR